MGIGWRWLKFSEEIIRGSEHTFVASYPWDVLPLNFALELRYLNFKNFDVRSFLDQAALGAAWLYQVDASVVWWLMDESKNRPRPYLKYGHNIFGQLLISGSEPNYRRIRGWSSGSRFAVGGAWKIKEEQAFIIEVELHQESFVIKDYIEIDNIGQRQNSRQPSTGHSIHFSWTLGIPDFRG